MWNANNNQKDLLVGFACRVSCYGLFSCCQYKTRNKSETRHAKPNTRERSCRDRSRFLLVTHNKKHMDIIVDSLLEGAQRARGTVIIVDVYRAFTTAAVALERGISKIIFVAQPEEALAVRAQGLADYCVGEVGGIPPEGFDFGNSPYEMSKAELAGKTMVHTTRAGTVGVTAAAQADQVYGTSLVNAKATVDRILASRPSLVTVVAMGLGGKVRTDEDEQCALYLRNLLLGRNPDEAAVRSLVRAGKETDKFMDPDQPHFHPEDVDYALRINQINQPIEIFEENGLLQAIRVATH